MPQNYGALEKVLRVGEGRRLKRLAGQADYVASLEPDFEALSDEELAAKTVEFRQRLENGESLEELTFEAFAAVREAAKRSLGMRHFDVQVMGAIVLHEGDIAEMKTGEGKTLVATMPLYLNALPARGTSSRHGERLPGEARRRVDGPRLRGARNAGVVHPQPDAVRRAQGGVRRRRHVRHELRVRLRLPARQHGNVAPGDGAAEPRLRDRRRGGLDPHRRGAHAADHLRRAGDGGADVLRLRAHREGAHGCSRQVRPQGPGASRRRRRLRVRREVQDRLAARVGDRRCRARARDREPLRPAQRAARQPPQPGA